MVVLILKQPSNKYRETEGIKDAGLYEMCYYMTGKSHTDPEATPFAMAVMQKMNDKCKEWRDAENIAYSVYGTPEFFGRHNRNIVKNELH